MKLLSMNAIGTATLLLAVISFVAVLVLAGMSAAGHGPWCTSRLDQRIHFLTFQACVESSATIITGGSQSNSEAHETVEECSRAATVQASYQLCPGDTVRPGITTESLQSLERPQPEGSE